MEGIPRGAAPDLGAAALTTRLRWRLPHPLIILLACVLLATILTWVLPAGSYQRVNDPLTGRSVVVAGSYAPAGSHPVGVMGMLLSVPQGIVAGADIIVLVLLVGGAYAALDQTGALGRLVTSLVGRTRSPRLIVIVLSLLFGALGAVENMHEEIIAMVPVLVVLSQGLGFGPITALGMSVGAAVVGSAFGPTNPFQSGIALKLAGLPALSQGTLRFAMLGAALALWIGWTLVRGDR